jgi:putative inorganic carbon (HCO3(-)) transporter
MSDYWPLFALLGALLAVATALTIRDWRWGAVLVAAALPFEGLLPRAGASGMKALTGLVVLALAIHLLSRRELLARALAQLRTDVSLALLGVVALAAASGLWAGSADAALGRTLTLGGVFLLLHVFALLDPPFLRRAWTALLASAAASVPLGLLLAQEHAFADEGRFTSGGLNPNDYAGLLLIAVLVGAGVAGSRALRVLCVLVALAGVLWSASRTAFVVLALAPLLYLAVAPPPARRPALARVALAWAAICLVAAGAWAFDRTRVEAAHARAISLTDYRNESTWAGRLQIWRGGAEMVRQQPLLGVGAGNFPLRAAGMSGMPRSAAADRPGPVAHNVFLGLAAELGFAGCALFALAVACALVRARRLAARSAIGSALLLGLIAWLLLGLSLSWEYAKIGYVLLGSVLALAAAAPEERTA